jgi:NTP pyrophosphatase (non-canonical NTP hydrolase)
MGGSIMFAIGDERWPGLSKLNEECGEVIQVIGKLMGARGVTDHWDGTNLKQRLIEELADLRAAIHLVTDLNLSEQEFKLYLDRIDDKLTLFKQWHRE